MIGFGSVSMSDAGHSAASLYQMLQDEY